MKRVLRNIRIAILNSFVDKISRIYEASTWEGEDTFNDIMKNIVNMNNELTVAIKSDKVKSTLNQADAKRDRVLSAIFTLLSAYSMFFNEAKRLAAETVSQICNKYKGLTSASYDTESAHIESMLLDLKNESVKEAIDTIPDLRNLLDELRLAQDEFNKANDEFVQAGLNKGRSATDIKKELISEIDDKLVPYLIVTQISKNSKYDNFIATFEAEVSRTNSLSSTKTDTEQKETE